MAASKQRITQSDRHFDYLIVSGASADTTIKSRPGHLQRVRIWAVGGASSKIEVYDGTVAAGTKLTEIPMTAFGVQNMSIWCNTSIHVKTTDSAGTARVRVDFL